MQELLEEASRESGASQAEVKAALGVLVGFLQDCCEERSVRHLLEQVPSLREVAPPRRGKGFFGSLLGGNAALLALPGKLARVGIQREQIPRLVPVILRWLQARTDRELWEEVHGQLPSVLTRG